MKTLSRFVTIAGVFITFSASAAPLPPPAFIIAAVKGDEVEVQMGDLATRLAQRQEVKDFGRTLSQDHTQAKAKAVSLAKDMGLVTSASLGAKAEKTFKKLAGLTGEAFDKEFVHCMIEDHEEDIKNYSDESTKGADPKVRAFANDALPVLQKHLNIAKDLEKMLSGHAH